jgi:catechol 2,3-dioxygenase-like lactoylglutathione lyase family enzyme
MALIPPAQFHRLARFGLTTANAKQLAAFYIQALGFRQVEVTRLRGHDFRQQMGIDSDAFRITLTLGDSVLELMEFAVPGEPYPAHAIACDPVFQHFAVVAADMAEAWSALQKAGGWKPITVDEPQRLPESAGSVVAFKFRDPEGHPLELLSFPPNRTPSNWQHQQHGQRCLGIDHSAIIVSDTRTSIAFYAAFGLRQFSCSHNAGIEQDRLDGLTNAVVDVTGLTPAIAPPHVELLCYEKQASRPLLSYRSNDIAATRLIFAGDLTTAPCRLIDPDGHHLMVKPLSQLSRFA